MLYTIKIAVDGPAFLENAGLELARLLHNLGQECLYAGLPVNADLHDLDGHRVGQAKVTANQPNQPLTTPPR